MFFSHKKRADIVLAIDISSGSVGAAVVELREADAPKILYSSRLPITTSLFQNRKHLLFAVSEALEHVITQVEKHTVHLGYYGKIRRSHIVFSSPWYKFETKVLMIKHKSPIAVTHEVINKVIKTEEKRFAAEVQLSGAEIVESRIIRTRLNGYDTPNPYGKKSANIEITFFVSLISKDILDETRRVLGSHFQHEKIEVSSFSLAAFTAIGGLMPDARDFIIVDVRGEMTDVSVVRDGSLYSSISFPNGRNGLIRVVAETTKNSLHGALSSIITASHGHLRPSLHMVLNNAIEPWKKLWLQSYTDAVKNIMSGVVAPKTIFLMGDSDTEVFFEKILVDMNYDATVYPLKKTDLSSYVEMTPAFHDPFLALETIFINQLSK